MKVGILQFELLLRDSHSLKDKRRVVKSLKDRLHREHLVAVAEVAAHEQRNVAVMGLACVSADGGYIAALLDRITAKLERLEDATLGEISREILSEDQIAGQPVDDQGEPLWTPDERRDTEAGADGQEN